MPRAHRHRLRSAPTRSASGSTSGSRPGSAPRADERVALQNLYSGTSSRNSSLTPWPATKQAPPRMCSMRRRIGSPRSSMGPCTPTRGLPCRMHSRARRCTSDLSNTFQFGRGGPGGWWIIFEPKLHLGEDILVPDLAGWRRERMPDYPRHRVREPPAGLGMRGALSFDASARPAGEASGLCPRRRRHLWLVDPADRPLEALELHDGQWLLIASAKDDDPVSIRPVRCDHLQPRRGSGPEGRAYGGLLDVGPRELQSRALYSANHPPDYVPSSPCDCWPPETGVQAAPKPRFLPLGRRFSVSDELSRTIAFRVRSADELGT